MSLAAWMDPPGTETLYQPENGVTMVEFPDAREKFGGLFHTTMRTEILDVG